MLPLNLFSNKLNLTVVTMPAIDVQLLVYIGVERCRMMIFLLLKGMMNLSEK